MTLTQPGPRAAPAGPCRAARPTLDRAREHLLGLQHEAGWWQGELETNVTMDAEDLMLRAVPRHRGPAPRRPRPPAGSGPSSGPTAPGPTSTAGPATCPRPSRRTSRCGWPVTRRTRRTWRRRRAGSAPRAGSRPPGCSPGFWLAMFGQWSWDDAAGHPARADLPAGVVPAERLRLGAAGPGRRSCRWPSSARSGRRGRCRSALDELRTGIRPVRHETGSRGRSCSTGSTRRCTRMRSERSRGGDGARAPMPRGPTAAVRRAALRRCAEWIIARQERDGCWGGIQPPWVYSLIALHLLGYGLDHPVIRRAGSPGWSAS